MNTGMSTDGPIARSAPTVTAATSATKITVALVRPSGIVPPLTLIDDGSYGAMFSNSPPMPRPMMFATSTQSWQMIYDILIKIAPTISFGKIFFIP